MASKALKGLTIKIGGDTSELLDALKDVEERGKSLSGELRDINKLLKLDPKNTELLAQKQRVLSESIEATEKKLATLKEAEKKAQEQFEKGEISEEQYRALQREIIATERKLGQYKTAAKETAAEQRRLADASKDVGDAMDEQADKTDDADDAAEDLDDSAGALAAGGLAAMTAAAAAAITAIVALAEETREYRNEMAKLDVAFKDNGFTAAAATKTYEELQSVLGETEQAVEAANNIAALAKSEDDLAKWTEIATGVYAKFGASLPIEGLAEAANETMRVGQITGPLADALNWAAAEGETFGVKMKKATKANEEWNKAVSAATSAEDYFNLALQECSTEQERQQLITETLTGLYSNAAVQFRETNKEVIASNKATEKWNKATAKVGKTVEPVMTDLRELGATLVEDVEEPLEDIAEYARKDVLPAIKNISSWTKSNLPTIKAGVVGVATAMVALKVATVANTIAQKGLKGAIAATTVAQKALNIVQNASPWGVAATLIAAATVALVAYHKAAIDSIKPVDVLTAEEKELAEAADEVAESFREQKKSTDANLKSITAQMDYVNDLAAELKGLADASGKVKKSDQERAQFILHELNEALGTEYKMVDGIILKYKDLKKHIDEVIASKKANLLLEAMEADYTTAIQNKASAYDNMILKQKELTAQAAQLAQAESDYAIQSADIDANLRAAQLSQNDMAMAWWSFQKGILDEKIKKEREVYSETKTAYDGAKTTYEDMTNTILTYESASSAALAGNYETTVDLLAKKGEAYTAYADEVDDETARTLAALETEAREAGEKAAWTKEQFEKGVSGFTKEMVTEAEKGYQEALGKFGAAYSDAYGLGENFGQGIADGIKIKNGAVGAAAIAQIREAVKAAKKEAEINSPSKKTMAIGEGLGEGTEVGVEKSTPRVERAAEHQMAAVLDAYRSEEVNAQHALRSMSEQQAARQANSQMAAAGSNAPLLEKILTAIENGQILTIDGDTVVGATANKMDSALGRRRAWAARGAIK